VIVWLNGTFGCGKTTTAAGLRGLIPSSRVFDPETVGYMLRPNLADHPVTDFQHWPPWRRLVVSTATELARFTGQHLIAPQTVLDRGYLDQIFAGLADAGLTVFHVVLDADATRSSRPSVVHTWAFTPRLRCRSGRRSPGRGAAYPCIGCGWARCSRWGCLAWR
jgi:hypothetical protein